MDFDLEYDISVMMTNSKLKVGGISVLFKNDPINKQIPCRRGSFTTVVDDRRHQNAVRTKK